MAIHYRCRHCGISLGSLQESVVDAKKLGFAILDEKERLEMVHYEENGDMIVETICEDCQETLTRNPSYHQWHTFLQ